MIDALINLAGFAIKNIRYFNNRNPKLVLFAPHSFHCSSDPSEKVNRLFVHVKISNSSEGIVLLYL